MKKLFVITLACLSCIAARAQDNSGFRIQGGFGLASMNFGKIANSYDDLKTKIKPGGFVGIGYERRLVKFFAIQGEVNYLNRGAKREFTTLIPDPDQRVRLVLGLHTIQIPVQLKFYIGDHFNLYAGPYVGFNVAASVRSKMYSLNGELMSEEKGENIMSSKYKDADGDKPLKTVDFGMDFGLEAVILKGFFVGGRVTQGFIDQTNNDYNGYPGIVPGDNKSVLNTSANLYAGYRF
jgi:hypothetical protein